VDDVGEDRIMPLMKEHGVFSLMLRMVAKLWKSMDERSLLSSASSLASVVSTEDFVTFKSDHVSDDDRDLLIEMDEDEWLEELCDEDDVRRKLRPLLDFTRECRRARK
jgi:hypothetical protein